MKYKIENENVLYFNEINKKINKHDINYLITKSKKTLNKTIRLCLHNNKKSKLHQMFIIHPKNYFVPPQYHPHKEEIIYVISGKAKLNYFKKNSKKDKVFILNKENFYHVIPKKQIHNIEIISNYFIFLEISLGPFNKNNTLFPNWLEKYKIIKNYKL